MLIAELNTKVNIGSYKKIIDPNDKIINFIATHCSEYLAIKGPGLLYRGMFDTVPLYFIGNPRTNRMPRGLAYRLHEKFIKCFKLVGFAASRNKTISCTTNYDEANNFGKPYIVFPLNGFKYTWSTKWADIGMITQGMPSERGTPNLSYEDMKYFNKFASIGEDIRSIDLNKAKEIIKFFGFTDRNLDQAMYHEHEVAIAGKYIAVNASDRIVEKLQRFI